MSIDNAAHLIYGVQIASRYADDVAAALDGKTVGVNAINAGPYDHGKTYLITASYEADLGEPQDVDLTSLFADGDPTGKWDSMLNHAIEMLQLRRLTAPGWILIAAQT